MENKIQPQDNAQALPRWTHLSWFQIQYLGHTTDNATAHVFRNGRQQVPIKILIEARNSNDEVVTLTNSELLTVTLVDYDTRQAMPNTDIRTYRNTLYDDYPESGKFPVEYFINELTETNLYSLCTLQRCPGDIIDSNHETLKAGTTSNAHTLQVQTFFLFLVTTSVEVLHLGAIVPSPIGGFVHTCSRTAPPGGAPSGGEFNSSLTVAPQTPRHYAVDQFSMSREDVPVNDGNLDVDVYTLGFRNPDFLIRNAILHMPINFRGWHFSDYVGKHNNYYHYAFTEETKVARHYTNGSAFYTTYPVNTHLELEGKISISRVAEHNSSVIYDVVTIGRVGYVDNHGNESIIYLRPVNEGNEIIISDN
jgi:hypothetical protein